MELEVLKSTGVIRRIDELGRIVIPKEIRRNLKIRDGENMEIFVEMESIILSKISKLEDSIEYAKKISNILNGLIDRTVIITDRESIIAVSGTIGEQFENKKISQELIRAIDNREIYFSQSSSSIEITNNEILQGYFGIIPIMALADCIGLVIVYDALKNIDDIKTATRLTALILGTHVDIG